MKRNKSHVIGCIILIIVLIIMILSGFKQNYGRKTRPSSTIDSYTTYVVEKGDTVWGVARKHPGKYSDIRKFIYAIEQINEIKASIIYPGQELKIPQ